MIVCVYSKIVCDIGVKFCVLKKLCVKSEVLFITMSLKKLVPFCFVFVFYNTVVYMYQV